MKSSPFFQQLYGFTILIDLESIEIKKEALPMLGTPIYNDKNIFHHSLFFHIFL